MSPKDTKESIVCKRLHAIMQQKIKNYFIGKTISRTFAAEKG